MKKIFTLLLAAMAAVGTSAQGQFKVSATEERTDNREITSVPNITCTFGTNTSTDTLAIKKNNILGYPYYIEGKTNPGGENYNFKKGNYIPTIGTFYKFMPQLDGILEFVGVFTQGKEAVVIEDGTPLTNIFVTAQDGSYIDYPNTYKFSAKLFGKFKFNVKAGSTYYVYVNGSKVGFSGYSYTLSTATIGTTSYATFCPTTTCKVPSGLTAYTAAYNAATGMVDLTAVADGIIPAKVGVILKGAAKDYTMEATETTATAIEGNELIGLTEAKTVADADNAFILVNDGGTVKFGKTTTGTTIAAGKAYLPIADGNAAKNISMNLGDATGINAVATEKTADNAFYTLSGMKTDAPVKGMLYIHNGKKFIAK